METTIHIITRLDYQDDALTNNVVVSTHLSLDEAKKELREYAKVILNTYGVKNADELVGKYLDNGDTSFEYFHNDFIGTCLEIHESIISEPRRPQYLAFYQVDNTCGFNRRSFDTMTDAAEILACLHELEDDEWHLYDVTSGSYSNRLPNLDEFVNDYNDEELDGSGWWSIAIY